MQEECVQEECPEGLPAWVMTFADLMSLLMCFFVLLLSFSEMDAQKFKQMAGSVKRAFGVQRVIPAEDIPMGTSIIAQEFSPGEPKPTPIKVIQQQTIEQIRQDPSVLQPVNHQVAETAEKFVEELGREIEQGLLEIEIEDTSLLVRISEKGSFGSGSAKLQRAFAPVLSKIARVLDQSPGKIIVSGHTDDIPIRTRQYPSNWVLSASRAASVVHYITRHGLRDHQRIQIRAYADTRPLVPNNSPANRAKNRRIEINIDTGDNGKPVSFDLNDANKQGG